MESNEIKHEFGNDNSLQCRTCLSVGRTLRPLRELASIYGRITSECVFPDLDSLELIQICWQCSSLLRKVVCFREQVIKAEELLRTYQSFIYGPLSSLISVTINDTNQCIYINDGNVQTSKRSSGQNKNDEVKTLNDINKSLNVSENELENIDLKKQKQFKSRWAIKRAEQNKIPKFKVSTNFDETFVKVHINNEELSRCIESERASEYFKSQIFKCNKCVSVFSDQKILLKHNLIFHRDGKVICDICNSRISNKRHLLSHLRKHYVVYRCVVCHFVCRKEMRPWHFETEHRKVFQCVKCKLQFRTRRDFFHHYKEWHEKFICDHCGIRFKMRYCIKDHIRKQHSPFECKPCDKTFARYNGLWLHNKLAHSPAAPAYCATCDAHYPDVYRLQWHLCNSVRHAPRNKLRIPCPSCDKIFTKKIYMSDHYNLVHLKLIKYRCELCDKNFIRNAELVKHKRKIHDGVLPPKDKICYICGRGFTTNKILQNHIRTHTGELPFACACGARFTQRVALHAHMRKNSHTLK